MGLKGFSREWRFLGFCFLTDDLCCVIVNPEKYMLNAVKPFT